jgi:hypothetical protein
MERFVRGNKAIINIALVDCFGLSFDYPSLRGRRACEVDEAVSFEWCICI